MKTSYKLGFSFGSVSGVISTLGLMVGLESGTQSKMAVIGGIIMIAIADSFSDALSMHVSEESQRDKKQDFIWQVTIATFISKIAIAFSFVIPFLFFEVTSAIIFNIIWGLTLVVLINYYVAKSRMSRPWGLIIEHLLIAICVVIITYLTGMLVRDYLISL